MRLCRRLSDASEVVEDLARVQELLAQEIRDLRDLTHELEPADFATRTLLEHLQELVDRLQRETGITARFVSQVEDVTLAPPVCHELARIAQEALVNVRKHSGARNVIVRFTFEAGSPKLIIDNDGRSLDFTGRLS
jgi:two-component system sensor histidine kinase DegS